MQTLLPAAIPAALAFAASLALSGMGRVAPSRDSSGRVWWAGLAVAAGVLAGWWWLFGALPASPRQLPERLPLLALALLAWTAAGLAWRRAPGKLMAAAGALGAGWWMAGAPRNLADLAQAAPVLAGVAIYAVLALRAGPRQAVLAAALLWAGLALSGLAGPAAPLALVLLGASLGALIWPVEAPAWGMLAALPFAAALAALAALPVLARGTPLDWGVALLPLTALLWPGDANLLRHRRQPRGHAP